ncbi:hypothetical protein PVAP13_6NG211103 [Panicum virgatum]|uniref:Uncharacterized protein n=1 Tax=Panicum virgatum TaxID=38727 RepID=A0A8T0QYS6_PANVG|nr:hypothetical protein PVAP13_6NG211103 [Panicum virgatum]
MVSLQKTLISVGELNSVLSAIFFSYSLIQIQNIADTWTTATLARVSVSFPPAECHPDKNLKRCTE